MMFYFFSLVLILNIWKATGESCESCLVSGKHYCADVKICNFSPCLNTITHPINCPSVPNATYAFDDAIARTQWLPLIGAGRTNGINTQKCFECLTVWHSNYMSYSNNWPTMKFSKNFYVNCSDPSKNVPLTQCSMITAVDITKKILVMSFRGTDDAAQLIEEILDFVTVKKQFFDSGYIYEYFYDAFVYIWQGGLEAEMRNLKYKYPDYELWVTGHSLGGALASVGASWVVKAGLFQPSKIKLLTVGQPRTGDYDYAMWHQNTFAYSYRVVHHHDIVPHIPTQADYADKDRMYHHRTEIWYDNDMSVGSPYNVCKEADGLYCSNQNLDLNPVDHLHYFKAFLPTYGPSGCPKL